MIEGEEVNIKSKSDSPQLQLFRVILVHVNSVSYEDQRPLPQRCLCKISRSKQEEICITPRASEDYQDSQSKYMFLISTQHESSKRKK